MARKRSVELGAIYPLDVTNNSFSALVLKVLGKVSASFQSSSFYQSNGSAKLSRVIYNFQKLKMTT